LNKKYGIAAIISGVIIVGVLIFTYGSNSTNSVIQNQQSNASNSIIVHPSANTTGRHFFVGVNETVTIKTTP
jgi:hypothetical protein